MTHRDDIATLRKAFKDGADSVRDALSMPSDPDLANYQKLREQDFMDMAREFGAEPVMEYVKRMELRLNNIKERRSASS